jgi:hypothetical protein
MLGVSSRLARGEDHVGIANWTMRCADSPGSERMACQEGKAAKARNHSRVASALPHSEGIAYKPPCGEIAMCPRVGRMGSIK